MKSSPPRHRLDDGYEFCRVINGGWQLSPGHSDRGIDADEAVDGWTKLVESGFTTFDVADIYAGVEALAGRVAARFAPGQVQIHTKCVPDRSRLAELRPNDLEAMVDRSLKQLGQDRLDLLQFHWWDFKIEGWIEALGTLQRLRELGKIRNVGVTNFDAVRLGQALDAGIDIRTNQVQYSLLDRRPDGTLAELCRRRKVTLLAYGALAGGLLTHRWYGKPRPAPDSVNRSLVKYLLVVEECGGWESLQDRLKILDTVARKHDVDAASVALRWVLDRDEVAATIVGAFGARHAERNRQPFCFELDADDRRQLDNIDGLRGDVYRLERESERHASIMRYDLHGDS